MPEYLAPGVYVEEIEIGSKPIEGVSTTTVGFLGETERGPVVPTLITGFEHYRRVYGGYLTGSFLAYSVEGFFSNGGKRCFIGRIAGKNADAAETTLPTEGAPAPASEPATGTGTTGTPATPAKGKQSARGGAITVTAQDVGTWGNRVGLKVTDASLQDEKNPILAKLFRLTVFYWKDPLPDVDNVVDPTDRQELRNPKRRDPALREDYDNLSSDPQSADYYLKRVNGSSHVVTLTAGPSGARPQNTTKVAMLRDGKDGDKITLADYEGQDDPAKGPVTGLAGLSAVDEISMLCAPDEGTIEGLTDRLIASCELLKDRFAILQAPQDAGSIANLRPPTDSKYAALYYPWIKILDAASGTELLIPPGGHVAGIYARSDVERGVHKAPANEVVRGAIGLQFQITKGDQEILNPRGVNCIRSFMGRGIRVWGARTISSDPLWKYVNVRRLMMYLEESIDEGTQWVVFEPNDQRLWARVRQTISDFLTRVWRDGALMGTTPEQAFFVKCDETTMLPDDIENGRLICLIGVAPVRPAEFVIFRIAQWRSGSAITE